MAWPLTDEAVTGTELEAHARKGIQMFSPDDGRPTRMLPVRGEASGPFAWSPDGRLVVVTGPGPVEGKRQWWVLASTWPPEPCRASSMLMEREGVLRQQRPVPAHGPGSGADR